MAAVKTLRDLRLERDKYVDPQEVLRLAKPLINSGSISKAGDDAWDIYEQTIFAALEVAEDTLALECLTRLTDKFPSSGRVHALRGMLLEATQDSSEAIKFYEKVLDMEPTNVVSCNKLRRFRIVLTCKAYNQKTYNIQQIAWTSRGSYQIPGAISRCLLHRC